MSLTCEGVWSYKKVLAYFFRKLKASSTNWLIWIISLKTCFANILSRICQIRSRDTLKGPKLRLKAFEPRMARKTLRELRRKKITKFFWHFLGVLSRFIKFLTKLYILHYLKKKQLTSQYHFEKYFRKIFVLEHQQKKLRKKVFFIKKIGMGLG